HKDPVGPPQTEAPYRVARQLTNLGRALARIHGRNYLSDHELRLLHKVAMSSIPTWRSELLHFWRTGVPQGTSITPGALVQQLNPAYGEQMCRRRLEELVQIGILDRDVGTSANPHARPPVEYSLKPQFTDTVYWDATHPEEIVC